MCPPRHHLTGPAFTPFDQLWERRPGLAPAIQRTGSADPREALVDRLPHRYGARRAVGGCRDGARRTAVCVLRLSREGGRSGVLTPLAIFGIDVGDLVGDVVRALLDLLVPDFTGRWANRLVAWLVALPQVTDWQQFPQLNGFRRELTAVGYGLLSLSFAGAALQAWAAGLVDGRPVALQAVSRAVLAAGALAVYPTLVAQLVLAVNHATAAIVRHPAVTDGINTAIGGAFVIGVVSSGLSLGLAAGALMAALFFLAAIFVMKVALTAMLCVLLVSGALVIALWPLPQGEGLARAWGAGLVAAVTIPVSWALVFCVVGLVASDSLVSDRLGPGLEAAVKPFVAVACLYLVYKTPGFLVAQARMMGVRLGGVPGMVRGAPGEARLRRVAHGHAALQRDRFRGLGAMAGQTARTRVSVATGAMRTSAEGAPRVAQARAAGVAVGLVSAAGGRGPLAGAMTAGVIGASRAARGVSRRAGAAARGGRVASDWWRKAPERAPGLPRTPGITRVWTPARRDGTVRSGASPVATPAARPLTPPPRPASGAGAGRAGSMAEDLRAARLARAEQTAAARDAVAQPRPPARRL